MSSHRLPGPGRCELSCSCDVGGRLFRFRSIGRTSRPLSGSDRILGQASDFPVVTVPGNTQPGWSEVAWLVVLQYAIVAIAGTVLILRALRRRGPPLSAAQRSFVVIAVTVAYTALVTNVVELGENNRFRFETDPLVCVEQLRSCPTRSGAGGEAAPHTWEFTRSANRRSRSIFSCRGCVSGSVVYGHRKPTITSVTPSPRGDAHRRP